jgi:hypothetical protein
MGNSTNKLPPFLPVLLALCLAWPARLSPLCGPSGEPKFNGYTFVNPAILKMGDDAFVPYVLNFGKFGQSYTKIQQGQREANLSEWRDKFCQVATLDEVGYVVYEATKSEVETILDAMRDFTPNMASALQGNTFAEQLVRNKCKDVVNYLIFAKECEPFVLSNDAWEKPKTDAARMNELIAEGTKAFKRTKSNWLRLRYAYQIVRLAHYKGDYEGAIKLYNYLVPKYDRRESIINLWLLGHKAGALMRLGRNVEASYLYTLIFKSSPSKRESAYRSFRIKTDAQWEQCLDLCQSDEERATLYVMRAMNPKSLSLADMRKVYDLHPQSLDLEPILIREVRKIENDFLGHTFRRDRVDEPVFYTKARTERGKYLLELKKFVLDGANEGKVAHPELWKVAYAYLEYLSGDLYSARRLFNDLEGNLADKALEEQVQIMQKVIDIHGFKEMKGPQEEKMAEILNSLHEDPYQKYKDFTDFALDRLYELYQLEGRPGKAFRCRYPLSKLYLDPKLNEVNDLLAIFEGLGANDLERQLTTNEAGESIKEDLLDMRGTVYMQEGKYGEALRTFNEIPRNLRDKYQLNPFYERFNDCVHCQPPADDTTAVFLNKYQIAEKLLDYDYKSKADPENGAEAFYWLGTALYNMSYFGNSWNAIDFYRSGASWNALQRAGEDGTYRSPSGNREFFDCSKALKAFEKCRELATNPELAARATFMAAKCERNIYYESKIYNRQAYKQNGYLPPPQYTQYFAVLHGQFQNTDFYKAIVKECKYFNYYVSR